MRTAIERMGGVALCLCALAALPAPALAAADRGYFKDQDCASVCPDGRRFDFNYTVNGDGSMQVDYTGGQICGVPQTPNGGRQPFSCKGDSLKFGNDYKKVR